MNYVNFESQEYNFIGEQSVLKGEFDFFGPTILCSKLEGKINIKDDSPLKLERMGYFEGEIRCKDFHLYGTVKGNIEATGKVVIHPTARFYGQLKAKTLKVCPGSIVEMDGITDTQITENPETTSL